MRTRWVTHVGAMAVGLSLLLGGCAVPASPDPTSWREDAALAVSDVAAAVATAELVLDLDGRSRLIGRYPQVTLVAAEESAAKAADGLTTQQPPRSLRQRSASVSDALDAAIGLIVEARIAAVDGAVATYPALQDRLAETRRDLARLETELLATVEASG